MDENRRKTSLLGTTQRKTFVNNGKTPAKHTLEAKKVDENQRKTSLLGTTERKTLVNNGQTPAKQQHQASKPTPTAAKNHSKRENPRPGRDKMHTCMFAKAPAGRKPRKKRRLGTVRQHTKHSCMLV